MPLLPLIVDGRWRGGMMNHAHTGHSLKFGLVEEGKPALTHRQDKILMYIGRGMTYREIAAEMYVSERTIRREVSAMKDLVGASTLPALLGRLK